MTYRQIRLVQVLLGASLLGFGGLVARELYRGFEQRQRSAAPIPVPAPEPADPVARRIELTRLDSEGRKELVLRAAESVGRTATTQIFRDVEIELVAGRERTPLRVTAARCEYNAESSAAHFEGDVLVRDESSLGLATSVLDYRRGPERVWTTEPVRFFRDDLEGTAGGLYYNIHEGVVELHEPVAVRLRPKSGPPIDVRARRAEMRRADGRMRFIDDVIVVQGVRRLAANDVQVYLTPDRRIDRIEAYENVELRIVRAEDEAEAGEALRPLEGPGTQRLTTHRLEAFVSPETGALDRMRALEGGRLVVEPAAVDGRRPPPRSLEAHLLVFELDEAGRIVALRGRGGVVLVVAADPSRGEPEQRLTARQLEAELDPTDGSLVEARCERAVELTRGDVHAEADRGVVDGRADRLVLEGGAPRLADPSGSLEAERIEIDTASGDIEAEGRVLTSLVRGDGADPFPGGGSDPVYFTAERFRYENETDRAEYTGAPRGFRGAQRIEARRIELRKKAGELEAWDDVRTVLVTDREGEEGEADAPTVTRAAHLLYRADERVLHYRGDVEMRGRRLAVRAKRIDVRLDEAGERVARIEAEGSVELETDEALAGGAAATYEPDAEKLSVRGERAWIRDGDKLTEGKELTFFLDNDRIVVDGREETRTRTTYLSKTGPPR